MKWEWQQTRVYLIDNGYRYGYALKSYSYKIWEIEYTGQWIKKSNDKDDLIILIDTIKEHILYLATCKGNRYCAQTTSSQLLMCGETQQLMNNDTAAIHIAVYTAFPVKSILICHWQYIE